MKETFEGPPTISERGVKTKSIFVPVVVPTNPLDVPTWIYEFEKFKTCFFLKKIIHLLHLGKEL